MISLEIIVHRNGWMGSRVWMKNLKSLKRGIIMEGMIDSLFDDISEMLSVGAHEVHSPRRNPKRRRHFRHPVRIFPGCFLTYLLHVCRRQPSLFCEKFQPVSSVGQVRRCHLFQLNTHIHILNYLKIMF